MKSRFQKKNLRKSRRQSLRRKIQRGGQEINCKRYHWPFTCPKPCKYSAPFCLTEQEYNDTIENARKNEEYFRKMGIIRPTKPGPLDRLMREA